MDRLCRNSIIKRLSARLQSKRLDCESFLSVAFIIRISKAELSVKWPWFYVHCAALYLNNFLLMSVLPSSVCQTNKVGLLF